MRDGSEDDASVPDTPAGPLPPIRILKEPLFKHDLEGIAREQFGDMVKAVVDVQRGVLALGGELHADEEAVLLDDGSNQDDLWGINIYPAKSREDRIEYDSMINLRPSQGNRSRDVEDPEIRERIRAIVDDLILD